MLIAERYGQFIEPIPNTGALCPHCKELVISKCGDIKTWHWAHKTRCEYESEPETTWHINWKKYALSLGLQIEQRFEKHIADIFNSESSTVIEVQHSQISPQEILDRNSYYKSLDLEISWIFDFSNRAEKIFFKQLEGDAHTFQQIYQKKSLDILFREIDAKPFLSEIYLDLGDSKKSKGKIFKIFKKYENGNGWGKFVDKITPFSIRGVGNGNQ